MQNSNKPALSNDLLSRCIRCCFPSFFVVDFVSYSCALSVTFGTKCFELSRANSLREKSVRVGLNGSSFGTGRPHSKSLARRKTLGCTGEYNLNTRNIVKLCLINLFNNFLTVSPQNWTFPPPHRTFPVA